MTGWQFVLVAGVSAVVAIVFVNAVAAELAIATSQLRRSERAMENARQGFETELPEDQVA